MRVPPIGDEPVRLEPREQTTFYARGATGRTYVFDPADGGQLVHPADAPALLASGLFRVGTDRARDESLTTR